MGWLQRVRVTHGKQDFAVPVLRPHHSRGLC
jgi:hypothetical protein